MDMRGEAASIVALGMPVPAAMALEWHGPDAIRDAVSGALDGVVSCHHGHMQEIQVCSPTTASAVWAMEDVICYRREPEPSGFRGYGHYHDTYVSIAGRWFIETTRLSRLLILPFGPR
jgi:hypothetical protein